MFKVLQLNLQFVLPEDFDGTSVDALRLLAEYHANPATPCVHEEAQPWPKVDIGEHMRDIGFQLMLDNAEKGVRLSGGMVCARLEGEEWVRYPIRK